MALSPMAIRVARRFSRGFPSKRLLAVALAPQEGLRLARRRSKVRRKGSCVMSNRSFAIVAAAVAAVGFFGPARAEPVGSVVASRGEAALERADARSPAAAGAAVMLNDRATTGDASRLDLKLGAATRLRLGANASLKVDQFVGKLSARSTLEEGAVLIDRATGAEKTFELQTPYGLLSARGTVFFAGPSRGTFGIFVQKGVVDVVTRTGSARLTAGEGVDFAPPRVIVLPGLLDGDPPELTPVKKWGAARIEEALDSVR